MDKRKKVSLAPIPEERTYHSNSTRTTSPPAPKLIQRPVQSYHLISNKYNKTNLENIVTVYVNLLLINSDKNTFDTAFNYIETNLRYNFDMFKVNHEIIYIYLMQYLLYFFNTFLVTYKGKISQTYLNTISKYYSFVYNVHGLLNTDVIKQTIDKIYNKLLRLRTVKPQNISDLLNLISNTIQITQLHYSDIQQLATALYNLKLLKHNKNIIRTIKNFKEVSYKQAKNNIIRDIKTILDNKKIKNLVISRNYKYYINIYLHLLYMMVRNNNSYMFYDNTIINNMNKEHDNIAKPNLAHGGKIKRIPSSRKGKKTKLLISNT